jgi:hypothetical protein
MVRCGAAGHPTSNSELWLGRRADDRSGVFGANMSFVGGNEAGAEDSAVGAQRDYRREAAPIGEAACGKKRQVVADRVAHRRYQGDAAGRTAHVAAGLNSLRDDRVNAGFGGGARFGHRPALP